MKRSFFVLSMIGLFEATAWGHISIASNPGFANVTQEVTFGVGHGCNGADTLAVTVDIPAGVTSVRPMRSDFGTPTVTTDQNKNVTSITWRKSLADLHPADLAYYKLVARMKLPNAPFTTVAFPTHQTCRDAQGVETIVHWVALPGTDAGADEPAPAVSVLPARVSGWNKFTVPVDLPDMSSFKDAQIVWKGTSAYSSNPITDAQIKAETGVTPLASLKMGDEIMVKY